jgi:hypothetical protein
MPAVIAESPVDRDALGRFIQLKLMSLGVGGTWRTEDTLFSAMAGSLLDNYRQKSQLLRDYRCPADRRIEAFLNDMCAPLIGDEPLRLPNDTFSLDAPGVARELSLPADGDRFESLLLQSYRIRNGVLHNPRTDRRTTQGTFHVAEGGLPIPADKIAVPLEAFTKMFRAAVRPPEENLTLPYTSFLPIKAKVFCSLLLRPIVVPAVAPISPQKTMEVRFFAPGALVSNLDFVETIFGNAGDPVLPENDAGLDVEHWTGHTGCVILAPHLVGLKKKDLGLKPFDQATPRQQRDGMCWKNPDELYNNGQAFKLTCRSERGVIVTLIADNYYGYCKKEVKTQISFAANLFGNAEEEHAGGAVAYPSYSLGDEFRPNAKYTNGRTFDDVAKDYPHLIDIHPTGYGTDRAFPEIIYIPHDACMDVRTLKITWDRDGQPHTLPLLADRIYVTPSGQKLFLNKHPASKRFRLVVTVAEGTFCHKPSTVSGGGKSEISKSLLDYMIYGPIYVGDLEKDLDQVEAIFARDHGTRWKPGKEPHDYRKLPSRSILTSDRSLGSVIKLLTPSVDYTDTYNKWLRSIPSNILSMVFLIKRLYKPEWGDNWRNHFSVDTLNGEPGHELKAGDRLAGGSYLRVGFLPNQSWRTFKLRQDFFPAAKIQREDDISASTVVSKSLVPGLLGHPPGDSVKIVTNTEKRLFQRPDDAIHPGFDKQTEIDMARCDNFISNFEPLDANQVRDIVERVTEYDGYSPPMRQLLTNALRDGDKYVVSSAHPRLVDGKPSKNPRYLQMRPDLFKPIEPYLAEMGERLWRGIPADQPITHGVDAVLMGRRNNPPEPGIRSLAIYSPLHYQELPELFMDMICSLTGKSPSTTGAGSEGALTKAPFNALFTTADLNAALVSFILTDLGGFSSAAGYVGPHGRVDHDISLMVPELWCRIDPDKRRPAYLIENGYLEKITDFPHPDRPHEIVPASRLGYRITPAFVRTYFGKLFDSPAKVFDESMLNPRTQDDASYVDGILNVAQAQQKVAMQYLDDGSIEQAVPPLKALINIMAHGTYEGKTVHDPDIRRMFTRDYLLASDWYQHRLKIRQQREITLWTRHVAYLHEAIAQDHGGLTASRLQLPNRLAIAQQELTTRQSPDYWKTLIGTIGADPLGNT